MDEKATSTNPAAGGRRPGKGKGKALNAIAAASGRDAAAIVESVEAAAKATEAAKRLAKEEEEKARLLAEEEARAKAKEEEVTPTQIFNQLSPQEQYRYECYRRCGFASKPIEKAVAKMLVEEAEKRYLLRRGSMIGLGGKFSGDNDGTVGDSSDNNIDIATVTDISDSSLDSSKQNNNNRKRRKQSTKQMLRDESKRRRAAMDQPLPYFLGGSGVNGSSTCHGSNGASSGQSPTLSNLVVPNSASEIVAVVSTLAKCYAQRLVSAAKRVADVEEEERETSDVSPTTTQQPIQPHHILEAHRYRQHAGLDPGFWMASDRTGYCKSGSSGGIMNKKVVGVAEAAALGTVDRDRLNYLAALESQDLYNKAMENNEQQDEDDKMDVVDESKDEKKVEQEGTSANTKT